MTGLVFLDEVERCADPVAVTSVLERLSADRPDEAERVQTDSPLREALIAVVAASPWLARICSTDPAALDVLGALDRPVTERFVAATRAPQGRDPGAGARLARWKALEVLRIAARDLLGLDDLEAVGANLSDLAASIADGAIRAATTRAAAERAQQGAPTGTAAAGTADSGVARPQESLTVIGMGKLGAEELNYASDIDLVFVGSADPRPVLGLLRWAWQVDLNLRPEGRSGPLIRTVESYAAYWDRWADTWEFQALLKARPIAGDVEVGARWAAEAAERVWRRPFGADELRQVRHNKARAENEVARRGLTEREIKLGRGGIRDIEFAVQLLQLVHGRADPSVRVPATLPALAALAGGGYVAADDAAALGAAYRFLRTVEHRLQLRQGQQVHAVPSDDGPRTQLARVLGYRDTATSTARAQFDHALRDHQATVRSIHERLFFRPLLEAFTSAPADSDRSGEQAAGVSGPGTGATLPAEAVALRLAAFGFSDATRTRQAIQELTRGLTRTSRLMQQLLPLLLEWLSEAPDPDLGLFGLRSLTTGAHRRDQLTALFRESAEAARELCLLVGTGPGFARDLPRHPDLVGGLADGTALVRRSRDELDSRARRSLSWRSGERGADEGLLHFFRGERLRLAGRDVLGRADSADTASALTDLAETVLSVAVNLAEPAIPFAVIAMGRLGGAELAYASDLDVLFVYDTAGSGSDSDAAAREAERVATAIARVVNGATPATRLYALDTALRPEGRHGPLARSLDAYAAYYERWAQPWERQALLRGRVTAGDADLGERFATVARAFVWGQPVSDEDVREIRRTKARIERERLPPGEDPQFHLKLGRGSLSDIEWTVQLLQLQHGVGQTGTVAAIDALVAAGALGDDDARILRNAYRFCETTRNRLYLVRGAAGDALPTTGLQLTTLARSLGTTPTGLRDDYRRQTRRARRVMERLFYGRQSD